MVLLKFLLIFFAIMWLISRVGGYLIRMFLGNLVKQNKGQSYTYTWKTGSTQSRKPSDGNVKIDYAPKDAENKESKIQGGDYIDYEEVK